LQPRMTRTATNGQGEFTIPDLLPGEYTLTVSYVGFSPFSSKVTVPPGQVARVEAVLKVATKSEQVMVYAERAHGEASAINRERTSDNILQVVPVEVITSLPNTNIADALGRMPSVTLERDEGEGKYVQIRGLEPRLSNVTVNGVNVPSPESSVRQIKLDVIPANLDQLRSTRPYLRTRMETPSVDPSTWSPRPLKRGQPSISMALADTRLSRAVAPSPNLTEQLASGSVPASVWEFCSAAATIGTDEESTISSHLWTCSTTCRSFPQ